jgi:HK97 family phage major capsid protein
MALSEKLIEKRDAHLASAQQIVDAAEAEARDLTQEENDSIAVSLRSAKDLDAQIEQHKELEERNAKAAEMRAQSGITAPAVVKSEPRTYTKENRSVSFLADAFAAQFNGDYVAKERLARHMNEEKVERRDVTSANFAGLIVPQYLTELAAPLARAGRPVADIARKHALPAAGLTISISKVTTGSSTAVQTEGSAVSETNIDDTKLDISVVTVAGQQTVSRQALERGTGVDALVMNDLIRSYHTTLDAQVVAEINTSAGQSVTATDASPTVPELYPKLLDAIQKIQTTYYANPNVIVMHPRRLAWILAALDNSNRPLAVPVPQSPMNALAVGDGGVVRYANSGYAIAGLPVVTDANVTTAAGAGTNEDVIYIGDTNELHLWEDGDGAPMYLRFDQPKAAELDVLAVVYGYSAYTAARYQNAWAKVTGTALVTPTF